MMRILISSILLTILSISGCTGVPKGLEPVNNFDPDRYLGRWYEIARLDHSFERNLSHVSATYTRKENGDIRVLNRGFDVESKRWKQIEGQARFIDDNTVGSLKVSFFGPFYGGYHIIALDRQDYNYAMVAGPNRGYLWILSREKMLKAPVYEKLVSQASRWNFDTDKLIRVDHSGRYPSENTN